MKILITGGAGFIGSNLAEALLSDARVSLVRVLDNLSTGLMANIEPFLHVAGFEFIQGDIRDYDTCLLACDGIDAIVHHAALGSVPRSITDPLTTNEVNITGTLNVFTAAKEQGIKRVVYAASSSTYGDSTNLPKVEEVIGNPLSPYAVTKYVNELYAQVYALRFDLEPIGLRYFNIFGPRQNPAGPYAAVIPLFMQSVLRNEPPVINGDGMISRDFTHVSNAVQANLKALFTNNPSAVNQVYNIACGSSTSLTELFHTIREIAGIDIEPVYGPPRVGDIPYSLADISKAKNLLEYSPEVEIREGLESTFQWYKNVNAHT
jgi:UDP-N-acetylglucosamine 4-epimerase